jgi:hypothetical protein
MTQTIAIIGAGPAGLMAAEKLAQAGMQVDIYDAMPSPGRKFLLAGIGGMNITHAEPFDDFVERYGIQQEWVTAWLNVFSPDHLREWIHSLGIETFVGTSGRVFPRAMKAAPLLRRWLQRLRSQGVRIHSRHRWLGWDATGALRMETPSGEILIHPDSVVLALGGASWPRLGSNGAWVEWLQEKKVVIAPLQVANCGFDVASARNPEGWSAFFADHFAGSALKNIQAKSMSGKQSIVRQGECVITVNGVEGGVIYTLSALLRDAITQNRTATLVLDLLPDKSEAQIVTALQKPRGKQSVASHWRKTMGIEGVKAALLRENLSEKQWNDPIKLAACIKAFPLTLTAPRPIAEAISTAGGVARKSVNEDLMLKKIPGVFCAGEMLAWEAPTGGYLLTACFASGAAAAVGVVSWLSKKRAQ